MVITVALFLAALRAVVGPSPPRWQTVAVAPYWNLVSATQGVEQNLSTVTMVSPWLYGLDDAGEIVPSPLQPDAAAALERLRAFGLPVVPTVSNASGGAWRYAPVAEIIHDPERRRSHVADLMALVRENDYAGIDIDYEELRSGDRDAFSAFVATLAASLHADGRILSVDVFAKSSSQGYDERNVAQDYAAIGRVADQIRLMAYDYHWSTSSPGPVAPLSWVEDVLAYARQQIPQGCLLLGLPLYGYDWSAGRGRELSWKEADRLARLPDVGRTWDDANAATRLTYAQDGVSHEVWFEDARSISAKLDVAQRYGVDGVFLWMYGPEDPGIWPAMTELAGQPVTRSGGEP